MKTTEELIQEFLDNGGQIEKLEPVEIDEKNTVGSTSKKVPELMTLAEGQDMFGEKQKRTKKPKKQDFSNIDMSLIPEHLHHIMKPANDKQEGDHKGGNNSEAN